MNMTTAVAARGAIMEAAEPIISVRGVHKIYGGSVVALKWCEDTFLHRMRRRAAKRTHKQVCEHESLSWYIGIMRAYNGCLCACTAVPADCDH